MQLRALAKSVKALPVLGPALHDAYLRVRYREHEILSIEKGALAGMRWERFMRVHSDLYVRGEYEPWVQEWIVDEAVPGSTFFDVGANAGYFTLLASRCVGETGRVIAVEPHPSTARILEAQLEINELHNVEVEVVALADRAGRLDLADDTASVMVQLALLRDAPPAETVEVEVQTLDALTRRHGPPDVVKIDVEGADALVLRGGMRTLRDHAPTLLLELHDAENAAEVASILRPLGYRFEDQREVMIGGEHVPRFVLARKRVPRLELSQSVSG